MLRQLSHRSSSTIRPDSATTAIVACVGSLSYPVEKFTTGRGIAMLAILAVAVILAMVVAIWAAPQAAPIH